MLVSLLCFGTEAWAVLKHKQVTSLAPVQVCFGEYLCP